MCVEGVIVIVGVFLVFSGYFIMCRIVFDSKELVYLMLIVVFLRYFG